MRPRLRPGLVTRAGVASLGLVLIITIGGRLLGFIREVLISSNYGTSAPADAFFTVQQLPTIISAFVFGPFMIAFVPYYAALREAGFESKALRQTIRTSLKIGGLITAVMIAGGWLFAWFDDALAAGAHPHFGAFAVILALSVVPLLITGLASVLLHARGQHVAGMAIAALTPAGTLLGLLVLTAVELVAHSDALPWSFVAGSLISGAIAAVALRRILRRASGSGEAIALPRARARAFRRELIASASENVGFSLNQALTVWLAAGLGGGIVATFAYAFRLSAFAFSGVSPLNVWIQTWMTRDAFHRDGRKLLLVIAGMAVLVVAIASVLILGARPLVEVVYRRGSFSAADAASVAAALVPLACYGIVMSLNQLMARYLFVHVEGARYSRVMIVSYVGGNGLKLVLIGPLGLAGIIWASVLTEGVALAYFLLYAVRQGRSGLLRDHAEATDLITAGNPGRSRP